VVGLKAFIGFAFGTFKIHFHRFTWFLAVLVTVGRLLKEFLSFVLPFSLALEEVADEATL
jgi:hypothetical protein